jgi:hypothetical protein
MRSYTLFRLSNPSRNPKSYLLGAGKRFGDTYWFAYFTGRLPIKLRFF